LHSLALPVSVPRKAKEPGYGSVAFLQVHSRKGASKKTACTNVGMNPALAERSGYSLSTKVTMLVTLVAVLCNSQLCLEKVVTTSDQSGITMSACAVNAQIGIADWLSKGPYREWRLQRYKCVLGKYTPKNEA
jgi:hypothetical protein